MRIVIGFSSPRGRFKPYSWLIKKLQKWDKASHVYLEFTSQSGVPMIYHASGSQTNFMSKCLFEEVAKEEERFEVQLSETEFAQIIKIFERTAGTPYSFRQAFGIALIPLLGYNPFKDGHKAQICTELAAYVLMYLGIGINEPENLTPKDFYDICKRKLNGDS